MTTLQLKKDLKSLIDLLDDTSVLEALHVLVRRNVLVTEEADDSFTAEDIAELDRRRDEYLRGEGTSYTVAESLEKLRSRKR